MAKKTYVSIHSNFACKIVRAKTEEILGKMVTKDPGRNIRFSGGTYSTDDVEEQKLIEKCPAFGTDIFDIKGKGVPAKATQIVTGSTAPAPYDAAEVAKIQEREAANEQIAKDLNEKNQAIAKKSKELADKEKALKELEAKLKTEDKPKGKGKGSK